MGKADDTRRRIIAAATAEFVAHGLAGARVDRIASQARINKAQLYHYVGNKDALFAAAVAELVVGTVGRVPLTVEDLPGYAARMYDAYLADASLVRLLTWSRLESRPTGDLFSAPHHDGPALAKLFEAQAAGRLVADVEVEDMWSMLIALCATWAQASLTLTADAADPETVHERRRQALRATVTRAFVR
ncbi:TetR/AcrR family transcriptional regulator [Nocardioides oleivorans]|uniref:TetR/AcrR family transcriptional regulator n=1 Tax=Nocardioides oleivorans TaxID=273676 RepID=A0A4V1RKR1_9ACTN|nr:TetR family transcriptional regulator [Nocardioides oleivorans]RYB93162.1 TetR/AcrR family transcriptional regulator [Nocardioides oleivorans]